MCHCRTLASPCQIGMTFEPTRMDEPDIVGIELGLDFVSAVDSQ